MTQTIVEMTIVNRICNKLLYFDWLPGLFPIYLNHSLAKESCVKDFLQLLELITFNWKYLDKPISHKYRVVFCESVIIHSNNLDMIFE